MVWLASNISWHCGFASTEKIVFAYYWGWLQNLGLHTEAVSESLPPRNIWLRLFALSFLGIVLCKSWFSERKSIVCKLTIIHTASSITSGIVRFQEGDGKTHPNTNDSIQHFFVKISPFSRKYFAPCKSSWFRWQFRIQNSVQVTRFLIFSLVCKNRGNTKNSVNMVEYGILLYGI